MSHRDDATSLLRGLRSIDPGYKLRHLLLVGEIGPTFEGTPLVRETTSSGELQPEEQLYVVRSGRRHRVDAWWSGYRGNERFAGFLFGKGGDKESGYAFLDAASRLEQAQRGEHLSLRVLSESHSVSNQGGSWLVLLHCLAQGVLRDRLSDERHDLPPLYPDRLVRLRRLPKMRMLWAASRPDPAPAWWSFLNPGVCRASAIAWTFLSAHASAAPDRPADVPLRLPRRVLKRPIPVHILEEQLNRRNLLRKFRTCRAAIDEAARPKTVEFEDVLRCFPQYRTSLQAWADHKYPNS